MAKQKDFDVFLSNIEPSETTISYISRVQNNLRDYLTKHSKGNGFEPLPFWRHLSLPNQILLHSFILSKIGAR